MPFVITLTGPSGSGKTTVVRQIQALGPNFGIKPQIIERYTTRPRRMDDGSDLITVDEIPRDCDLVYEQYGDRYGLRSRSLFVCLATGQTPIVIVNDIRIVADIRTMLRPLTRSLFLFRSFSSITELTSLAARRGVSNPEVIAARRLAKAEAIYRIYIENIHLFDHVLINAGAIVELEHQLEVVLRGFGRRERQWPLRPYGLLSTVGKP